MSEQRAPTTVESAERIQEAKDIFDDHPTMTIALADADAPWVAKVFFVEDEPSPGRLDLCCSLLLTSRKLAILRENPVVAFVVAGELPDRWVQGTGRAEIVADETEGEAIFKRLRDKSDAAGPFLARLPSQPVRIHVQRMKLTDVRATPPITEFTFE